MQVIIHCIIEQSPGDFIYHAPCLPHSIHVPLTEPLLTIYAWTGQVIILKTMIMLFIEDWCKLRFSYD